MGDPDQTAIFDFLADPATHGMSEPVLRFDTHGAAVFLAGDDAWKVKRAVRFPFMDFSTLEKRHTACESELRVNKLNAPGIYLGVVPITADGGWLAFGGKGEVVEWAVHLRRFDEDATLDRLAEQDLIGQALIDDLGREVAAAHNRAPVRTTVAATEALGRVVSETAEELTSNRKVFPADQARDLEAGLDRAFIAIRPVLEAREQLGEVRHCHGDLHLGNVVKIGGKPVLFDAIEFDDAIATTDVLYDLAFLLMDLWHRGLNDEAARLMNRYLWSTRDEAVTIDGLAALPLFLSLRAAIRAKVAAQVPELDDAAIEQARGYLTTANALLKPAQPRLVAVGGLSGTGKSTLAAALAARFDPAPGAIHLRSDIERKRLFGVHDTDRLPPDAYGEEYSECVHKTLFDLVGKGLDAGRSVIADATFMDPQYRDRLVAIARNRGVPFTGLWLDAPIDELQKRVTARKGDASDATADVVRKQAEADLGAIDWQRLDASQGVAALVRSVTDASRRALD